MSKVHSTADASTQTAAGRDTDGTNENSITCPNCRSIGCPVMEVDWICRCMGCWEPFRDRADEMHLSRRCPSCGGEDLDLFTCLWLLFECSRCDALLGIVTERDISEHVVLALDSHRGEHMRQRYFDLMLLGAQGSKRVHGWYNPETKRVVQFD